MSRLRNVALGAVLLALGCSSTDPPESSLKSPEQRMESPGPKRPTATTAPGDAGTADASRVANADPGSTALAEAENGPDAEEPDFKEPGSEEPGSKEPDAADAEPDTRKPDTRKPDARKPDARKPDAKEPDAKEPQTRQVAEAESKKPRDLQVLPRSWSLERVEKYMKSEVERGLGVDCAFCHVKGDYAADHAHKDVARRMMRMTRDLNRQYFKGKDEITCYSCHKGKKEP